MNKSVYSIVLADEVVAAIDAMAYEAGTSRSNMINQILAAQVSCTTPEMRMRDIFQDIGRLMDDHFQVLSQSSASMMSMKSPLRYKYRPTIRYSVELFRDFSQRTGRLKVIFRTQSSQLIEAITQFFLLWSEIEKKYLSEVFTQGIPFKIEEGKFTRDFYAPHPEHLTDSEISSGISRYIQLIDKCIQMFFDCLSINEKPQTKIEEEYKNYLSIGTQII